MGKAAGQQGKWGVQLNFVIQVRSIFLNKMLQESIRLAGSVKLSDQIISQMRSATTVESKKLEALSGCVRGSLYLSTSWSR
jgi:hypothetical protein